jgi:porphobilinogen synthase
VLLTDVCLCEYTCTATRRARRRGRRQRRDARAALRTAVSHAAAGRRRLPERHDGRAGRGDQERPRRTRFSETRSSYASVRLAFYGPFREAADSTPAFGDRRGYQLDPANVREALRECELDVAEGADVLLVKPALPNLDVLRAVREHFDLPVGAYNVSGEYAMLKAAAARGWLDERQAALESLTAIVRAGADRRPTGRRAGPLAVATGLWETIALEAAQGAGSGGGAAVTRT